MRRSGCWRGSNASMRGGAAERDGAIMRWRPVSIVKLAMPWAGGQSVMSDTRVRARAPALRSRKFKTSWDAELPDPLERLNAPLPKVAP